MAPPRTAWNSFNVLGLDCVKAEEDGAVCGEDADEEDGAVCGDNADEEEQAACEEDEGEPEGAASRSMVCGSGTIHIARSCSVVTSIQRVGGWKMVIEFSSK
jgi:hypothetical protein